MRGLGGQVLREYFELGGSWSWVRDHVWAGKELVATVEPSGTKCGLPASPSCATNL